MALTAGHWRGTVADLRALLAVQHLMAISDDGRQRLRRAQLLLAGGCPAAAHDDAAAVVAEDPCDPVALLALAGLAPGGGHDAACAVIASPFATPPQRQAALRHVDAASLPLVLTCDLEATLRLTLLQRPEDRCTLDGMGKADFASGLGRHADLVATDLFLVRDSHRTRTLDAGAVTIRHAITVAPLQCPVAVASGPASAPLWIVLPVRDGGAALAGCLGALAPELDSLPGCRLIVVDDGSALPETAALLDGWRRHPAARVMTTPRPLGFTGAVNHGLAAVGRGPVLLLNSDTLVPPGTLARLLAHLSDPAVGTVTPFSNNAGTFSVPVPRVAHLMPDAATCAGIAAEAWQRNRGVAVDVLTGNGFCMLVSAACLAATGALSTHYDSGYYEEVDFCLRARARGFRHVAATDCFVGHVGAASYGAARRRLVAANSRRIAARHPTYRAEYMRFALADPLAPFRARLTTAAGLAPAGTPGQETGLPERVVLLQGPVLPVRGPAAAWRPIARKAGAAGLLAVPEDTLLAAGLRLCPAHGLAAVPLPGGGLRVTSSAGRPVADLTEGPQMAELARRIAASLHDAQTQALDGLPI